MTLESGIAHHRDAILKIAADRGARNIRVFGSVARGESGDQSDVDFLVEMEPGRTLFDVGASLWTSKTFWNAGWMW